VTEVLSAGQRILYLRLSFTLSPPLHHTLATTPTRATKTTMRAERNGEESAKNGDERYMREIAVEFNREKRKKRESIRESNREREYMCVYVCVWKWNKMLMPKGGAGNERTERTRSQEPVAARSYKYV